MAIPCLEAADWPTYRHDLARSGVTAEKVPLPLYRQWVQASAPAPQPAWPEPGRELNRQAFDYAYGVTAANGLVFFGSSADHKVYAVDRKTGRERWHFFTEGPVRFSPTIDEGRAFVASDDGWLYCLSAAEGKLLWRFRGGPREEKVLGNEQMISRWPLRTGVGVADGVVYFTAGMWPNEGVYVYALSARDGRVIWRNETSGAGYQTQPHPGSFAMTGVSPQGYVLANGQQLFVPTGRNVPAAYHQLTGELLYYRGAPTTWNDRWGGTWNFLARGLLFGWTTHHGPDMDIKLGEYAPDPKDGMIAFDAATGREKRVFLRKLRSVVRGDTLFASGGGTIGAYDFKAWLAGKPPAQCARWETKLGRTYALILAGDILFAGGKNQVTAINADSGEIVWSDKVDAQVRELAVADERVFVSTTQGQILCYSPNPKEVPAVIARPSSPNTAPDDATASNSAQRILAETGKTAGFGLVIGARDAGLLTQLARQSELKLYSLEPDAGPVAAAREALDAAGLYGTRVTVHHGSLDTIVYPDYFADLIVARASALQPLRPRAARELYRLLHPYGGVARLACSGGKSDAQAVKQWLAAGGVPEQEIRLAGGAVVVRRGALPGAGNWTHQYANAARTGCSDDTRVRLPVKLLWFGKPGPARLISRHWKGPSPLVVNGRMFVTGQKSLIAADAYNGRELWRRDFARAGRWPVNVKGSPVAADEDSVYLLQDKTCLRLDAATGKTLHTYAFPSLPEAPPPADTAKLKWTHLAVLHDGLLGSMGDEQEAQYVFGLNKKDGGTRWTHRATHTVNINALAADERRVYLIDRQTARAVAEAKRRGQKINAAATLLALDAASGKPVWQTRKGLANGLALWLAKDTLVATSGKGFSGYRAATGSLLYTRDAKLDKFPVIVGDTIYAYPAAYDLSTGRPRTRSLPFTGQETPWRMTKSYGCGQLSAGCNVLMFRSGTLGLYDLSGDSGVHNFGGIRAGCYVNAIAADGIILSPPEDAACTCSYSFRTTVALAPATQSDDWSIFYDHLPETTVKRVELNLGAPGDRRETDGQLWLAAPRPPTRTRLPDFAQPFRFTVQKAFGPYRRPATALPISGTDRPWIYANGLRGLKRAELDLNIFGRGYTAWPVTQPPVVDGRLDDPCWDGFHAITVPGQNATVTLRCDARQLYVAYQQPPVKDPEGQVRPWRKTVSGPDAPVWQDDAFELHFSHIPQDKKAAPTHDLHLGVSASGARYDAAWKYVPPFPALEIPRLELTLDGQAQDWADRGLGMRSLPGPNGHMRPPADFDPSFRLGWNEQGLLVLAEISDDNIHASANPGQLAKGDSLELFLTPRLGSGEGYELLLAPGTNVQSSPPRTHFVDRRKNAKDIKLAVQAESRKTTNGYVMELLLPWKNLRLRPRRGLEFGLQLLANDKDAGDARLFQAILQPGGNPISAKNPSAFRAIRLADRASQPIQFKRGSTPDSSGAYTAAPPLPYPLTIPPLGARGEDRAYAGQWTSAVNADSRAFTAELAIPWRTLTDAGLGTNDFMLALAAHGPLANRPALGQGYETLIRVPDAATQPRRLTVRLHFAEPDAVPPGQRVFDVKVQGKVRLKNFDIARAAGGPHRAVVQEIKQVVATRSVNVELVSKAKAITPDSAPILNGIEVLPAAQ